ncbi:hypothetical protein LTR99_005713 [Exophiala xenobiotica]|uniref:NAD(P)-binding protein n=1 Tax=Vermiconidia calcicola TaxID=1690605 RepID=A0AAV9QDH7_9PEZI|nr:hypothetical protein LTR41_003093 [Exophiala xenobiotica]KAK5540339.1 hypothetical protein LTR23_006436 [Chaetothyriales sp. CCFEE 6169]KAK5541212.1 hypothetical protein LTR25_002989 [Vermiconidia calcicola]KAK5270330.1 hypothetical protein LTR96_004831 [Exophiala xenobiotica]KAK5302756.1 hypothetical protein LTR99_005713 [Exophiala xenobiotica]
MSDTTDPSLAFTLPVQLTKTIHRQPYPFILPENNRQDGKIVLVTGGGTGIGAAAAHVWVRAGAEGVVIAGRRQEKLDETASSLKSASAGTKILTVKTDITISGDVEKLFSKIKETFGRTADVVLANAGWSEAGTAGEHPVDKWWKIYEINVKGVYATIHHFIRSQSDPATPTGTIVVVGSAASALVLPGLSAYSTSKFVGQRIVDFIDREYPTLRVFDLLPGVVVTPMMGETYRPLAKDHPDLVGMVSLWLAQPRADFLSGQLVSVNWDLEAMEAHAKEISEKNLLRLQYLPILPVAGGSGI